MNKNTMKAFTDVLLGLCLLCCFFGGISVKAATSGEWEYTVLNDGTVEITDYTGSAKALAIPSTIAGKKVTSIGASAFYACDFLTGITIPNSVMNIGYGAFEFCDSLTSITIPNSVTSIGARAFYGCYSLTSITIPNGVTSIGKSAFGTCSSLVSITIPNGVTSIGEAAFDSCSSLVSITIPNSVTSIGRDAFSDCDSLTSITIPNSVTSIGAWAFFGCASLTSITIPSSVTNIGREAFGACSSLTSINVASGSSVYASQDGILFNKALTKLLSYPGGKIGAVTIPDSVTSIGEGAFRYCKNLKSITISNNVKIIEEGAFESCEYLENVTIPNSVTNIGSSAFHDCVSLTSITIPNSVTSIGKEAFLHCTSLTGITIPNSVTSIGEYAVGYYDSGGDDNHIAPLLQFVIHGDSNSVAQQYAEKNRFAFTVHTPVTDPAVAPTCTTTGKTEGSHCSICEMVIKIQDKIPAVDSAHTPVTDSAVVPTCTTAGKAEGSHCSICGEIIKAQQDIPATGHTYVATAIPATPEQNGSIVEQCSVCGELKTNTIIYAPSDIRLVKNSYTYNGKNKKPAVTVKDSNGNVVDASNYTVTYPKACKAVGKYTVAIAFNGNYSGTAKLTYTIKPKGTTISKLTAKKKSFMVKWKKQTDQTTGYQIQYSTNKNFKGAKTVTVGKSKKVSTTVSKLKANKKYYVRVRTYKIVKVNGKNTKIYSVWSKAQTVKTKK